MQLYAITDGRQSSDVVGWAAERVDFIQLREKDLEAPALVALVSETLEKIDRRNSKVLVNVSSFALAEMALAAGADGVHLAGKPIPGAAGSIRQRFASSLVSVPCHRLDEVKLARREQVDLILYSPVYKKLAARPQGLEALGVACRAAEGIPVFALGGVTAANAQECVAAGAAGVAGIRLFAGEEWRRLSAARARYIVE